MTDTNHEQDIEVRTDGETPTASERERGGLGLAALLWLLGVPGLIILLVLLL